MKRAEFSGPLVEQYGVTEGFNPFDPREKTQLYRAASGRSSWSCRSLTPKGGPDLVEFTYAGRDAVRVTAFVNAVRDKWQDEFMQRYGDAVQAVQDNIRIVYDEASQKYLDATGEAQELPGRRTGSDYFGKDPAGDAAQQARRRSRPTSSEFELELRGLRKATLQRINEQLEEGPAISATRHEQEAEPGVDQAGRDHRGAARRRSRTMEQTFTDEWPTVKEAKRLLEEEQAKLEKIEQFLTDAMQQGRVPSWVKLTNDKTEAQNTIAVLQEARSTESKKGDRRRSRRTSSSFRRRPRRPRSSATPWTRPTSSSRRPARAREAAKATRERVGDEEPSRSSASTHETTPEEAKFADPVYPNFALFAGIGAFIGLLIGGGLAFIAEFSAASFTTPNQVRYMLQVPVLGEVAPLDHPAGRPYAEPPQAYRVLVVAIVLILAPSSCSTSCGSTREWRADLPPCLRDFMRKLYGGGRR